MRNLTQGSITGHLLKLSASLTVISLLAGAGVIVLAEFGTLRWLLLLLLGWLLTLGLPTTLAIVTLAAFWRDLPLGAFIAAAFLLGFVFQTAALSLVLRLTRPLLRRWRTV